MGKIWKGGGGGRWNVWGGLQFVAYLATQWPAVTTWRELINAPPHRLPPTCTKACQGNWPNDASVPPTIRFILLVLRPQSIFVGVGVVVLHAYVSVCVQVHNRIVHKISWLGLAPPIVRDERPQVQIICVDQSIIMRWSRLEQEETKEVREQVKWRCRRDRRRLLLLHHKFVWRCGQQ